MKAIMILLCCIVCLVFVFYCCINQSTAKTFSGVVITGKYKINNCAFDEPFKEPDYYVNFGRGDYKIEPSAWEQIKINDKYNVTVLRKAIIGYSLSKE